MNISQYVYNNGSNKMDRMYLRPPIHVIWGEILHFKHPERFVCMYVCMHVSTLFRAVSDNTRPAMSKTSLDFGLFCDVNQNLSCLYI